MEKHPYPTRDVSKIERRIRAGVELLAWLAAALAVFTLYWAWDFIFPQL